MMAREVQAGKNKLKSSKSKRKVQQRKIQNQEKHKEAGTHKDKHRTEEVKQIQDFKLKRFKYKASFSCPCFRSSC